MIVTVIDQKTGEPITDLNERNFKIVDDKTRLRVDELEFKRDSIDIMLLIDTSLVGEMVRPLAGAFINELGEKEQMAIVSYHDSADLIQDFTASKQLLHQATEKVQYGNNPRVLDALYAAIDGGFTSSAGRRVIVVLSAGVEGRSRVTEGEVLRLARRRGVSIFPVYIIGAERGMFQRLSDYSGGALFAARRLETRTARVEPPCVLGSTWLLRTPRQRGCNARGSHRSDDRRPSEVKSQGAGNGPSSGIRKPAPKRGRFSNFVSETRRLFAAGCTGRSPRLLHLRCR